MKLLKNQKDIRNWLDMHYVRNYKIIENDIYGYVVNVQSDVNLISKGLKSIDVKFNDIYGEFNCSDNSLTSLLGSPERVKDGFNCSDNFIVSLEHIPKIILSGIDCSYNQLKDLKCAPKKVNKYFTCNSNKLLSLEFCPQEILGYFEFENNDVQNLEFFPSDVTQSVNARKNPKLNQWQEEMSFKVLYEEHQRQAIEMRKRLLDEKISTVMTQNKEISKKTKI